MTGRNADLFRQADRPAHYGGNKIPNSYLDRMSLGRTTATTKDDFDEMPWQLQRFVRSICSMHPAPPPVPTVEDDDDDD